MKCPASFVPYCIKSTTSGSILRWHRWSVPGFLSALWRGVDLLLYAACVVCRGAGQRYAEAGAGGAPGKAQTTIRPESSAVVCPTLHTRMTILTYILFIRCVKE